MPAAVTIRAARAEDSQAIAKLLGELGYPASANDVTTRLERMNGHEDIVVLVADVAGGVVGVATGHVFWSIHASSLVAWLTTLVVSDQLQQSGVGRALASAVEQWARSRGAVRISVTSGKHRDGAHAFYEHLGYERTGIRLTKSIT